VYCVHVFTHEGMTATSIIMSRTRGDEESTSSAPKSPAESSPGAAPFKLIRANDASFALENFECSSVDSLAVAAAVAGVAARIEPVVHVKKERKAKNRRQKVVTAQACSRDLLRSILSRDNNDEEEEEEERKGDDERGMWAERNSGVAPHSSGERQAREKKSIPSLDGVRGAGQTTRGGCRRLPFAAMHEGANDNSSAWQRPSYRPSRCSMSIPVPFSHPPARFPVLSNPLSNDSRQTLPYPPPPPLSLSTDASKPNEWRS